MILKIIGIALPILLIGVFIMARSKGVSPLSWKLHKAVYQKKSIAINGYDPVAYFVDGKATEGSPDHSYEWKESKWQFSSPENLARFKSEPARYLPEFGGWCSFAVTKGFTANPNSESWMVHEDRLYLFADEKVKASWSKQLPQVLETGKKKWAY